MTRAAPRRSPLQVSAPPPRRAHLAIVPPRGTAPRTPPAPMRSSGLLPSGGDSGGACRPPQAPRRGIPAPGLASASPVPIASPGGPRGPYRVLRCAARPPSSHPCCGRGMWRASLPANLVATAGASAPFRRWTASGTANAGSRLSRPSSKLTAQRLFAPLKMHRPTGGRPRYAQAGGLLRSPRRRPPGASTSLPQTSRVPRHNASEPEIGQHGITTSRTPTAKKSAVASLPKKRPAFGREKKARPLRGQQNARSLRSHNNDDKDY